MRTNAQIILQSGEIFHGNFPMQESFSAFGEVVFTTGMVGYVEALTDPSYAGQILVFTYPLIGNYGVPERALWESAKIHAKAVVVSELSPFYSNHLAQTSLLDWLRSQQVPCMTGVDTRALTKCLRSKGSTPGAMLPAQEKVGAFEDFEAVHWVEKVSIKEPVLSGAGDKLIVVVDCGIKENILTCLQDFPVRIKRVPYNYDFTDEDYDGVLISNGPGDPTRCTETIRIIQKAMQRKKPMFGICLGIQLMALAIGAKTQKLSFGHRSHNQPCLQVGSDRCYLTSQNHGYVVNEKSLPHDWRVSFRNLNDDSVAGIAHESLPFFSVQFHPEAAAGPEDTRWLFKQFYQSLYH